MMLALSVLAVLVSAVTASPLVARQGSLSAFPSCLSLRNACNGTTTDLNDFFSNPACVILTVCLYDGGSSDSVAGILRENNASNTQPRLSETVFQNLTGGSDVMTQQNFIDAYYRQISETPDGQYPPSAESIIPEFEGVAAWTGDCDSREIPYSNFADWLQFSSVPGVCPAVASCDPTQVDERRQCVPQPISDNGSCAEMANQCQIFVTGGLFQSQVCILASMCYAEASTDVLLNNTYPSYVVAPTSATEERLSIDVFHNMTNGADVMTEQNAIDAYYNALTGTYTSLGGPFGAETPFKTDNNGPYPLSSDYVENFWSVVSAWTGFCDTRTIPYANLADYLSYASTSGYHPTC